MVPSAETPVRIPPSDRPAPPVRRQSWRRLLTVPIKVTVGAFLTQMVFGGVLVFGWMQSWTRRAAFRAWWRQSAHRDKPFEVLAETDPILRDNRHAPNWLGTQGYRRPAPGLRGGFAALVGSALAHARRGVQGLLNVWALTLPGLALMALGWWGGWLNSFHKGYEQHQVGPLVSLVGIALFLAAMFYVPMATVRQAVTDRWRAFWQWRVVWTLVRHAGLGMVGLALLFVALNAGAMILKTWPYFMPQAKIEARTRQLEAEGLSREAALLAAQEPPEEGPDWNRLTDAEALAILNRHFFLSGFYLFGALLLLRTTAARVYAGAVQRAIQDGSLGEDRLAEEEWRVLHTLGLLEVRPPRRRSAPVRWIAWAATRTGRLVCGIVLLFVWFAFVAQTYIAQFFHFHPVFGWLNQPLVQLPWFRYIPAHLADPVEEWFAALVAILLLGLGALVFRSRQRSRERP